MMTKNVIAGERNKPLDKINCDTLKKQFKTVDEACSEGDDDVKKECWNRFVTSEEDKAILEKCDIRYNSGYRFSGNDLLISVLVFFVLGRCLT